MIKEKRRRQRMLKRLLIALAIFCVVAVIAAFIVVKVFVVKTVKVEGNKLYNEQLIRETVLNDEYSWNSLYVLLKYKFVDTQEVPFIDTMEIKLNSPSSLTIKVYEKGLIGYLHIPTMNQMAYFDKDGFVVETSTRVIENVPRIDGVPCEEVVLFEKLPIDDHKLRDMLTLTQTLKREGLEPDAIHFGAVNSPVVYYGNTEVWLGSMELLTQKVERLNEILPNVLGIDGILHMENWTEETANIIFEKIVLDTETEDGEDAENKDGETENDGVEAENSDEDKPQDGEDDSAENEADTPNNETDAQN